MPTDGDTPSAGWKAVYASMEVSTDVESRAPCPECDEPLVRIDEERSVCPTHGLAAD